MIEKWLFVKDSLKYMVSNRGRVKSFCKNKDTGKIMKPGTTQAGHLHCAIHGKSQRVHRLVLEAFGPPQPSKKHECRHLDGNPKNNNISNLIWGTRQQNIDDRTGHGTTAMGETHGRAKLTEAQAKEIKRRYKAGELALILMRQYGISKTHVHQIITGTRWKHLNGTTRMIASKDEK